MIELRGDKRNIRPFVILRNHIGVKKLYLEYVPTTFKKKTPLGTCLVNKYSSWPSMNKYDIKPNF